MKKEVIKLIKSNEIRLKKITREQFNYINNKLEKVNVKFNLEESTYGILYKNKIVGLISLSKWYTNDLTINIEVLKEYRGKNIATYAIEKIIEICGKVNVNIERFLYNTSPNNISANKAIQKLNWSKTSEFDDNMILEGTSFFNIYYKENPYYKRKVKKNDE